MPPIIAIVGRPNVGKSSLFNRIIGKRDAVVDDLSGVTRDRHYKPAAWQGQHFLLVDTGGMIPFEKEQLHRSINEQIHIAIREAAVVLFVVEAGCDITDTDEYMAKLLRKNAGHKTLLVVNKADSRRGRFDTGAFHGLGLGEPFRISAQHGSGTADLLDAAVQLIKKQGLSNRTATAEIERLKIAVVGRPNAGKSSLVNKLLKNDRMIVDDVAGTTRDSIDSTTVYKGRTVLLIDTAGLRKKSHVTQDIEYYFNLRAIKSIERCDVCVVVVDTGEEIGVQDLRIVTKALSLHKGILLAWNKWDLVEKKHDTFDKLVAETRRRYLELRHVPMVAVSALTGQRVNAVLDKAFAVAERMTLRVVASEFEDRVFAWIRAHPHPAIPENPVRILGARQVPTPFPCFCFFSTNHKAIAPAYVRYLTNKIYDAWGFEGCPVTLEFRAVKKAKHRHPFKPGRI
ncbi:MAG: ribosome biogenesis GTPase Der, partial [Chitinispirillaceae bacterium]|nr:ribosome biogenesis GTPase Der [Chitinispirillaceae bacterium]